MISTFTKTLTDGWRMLRDNPQLWFTLVVAITIFASFTYSASRFIAIARNAQDRLVNVRVGTLLDAFVPLANHLLTSDPLALDSEMYTIAQRNPTIVEFVIATQIPDGAAAHTIGAIATTTSTPSWTVTHAAHSGTVGSRLAGYDFAISLALADPNQSFTFEETRNGERFFRTIRAVDAVPTPTVIITRQTLSEADQQIAASIRSSIAILVMILAFLLFLFLRHARIIDYTVLYRRLKEVDQLKDDFISMASHELRTPLTAIRGFADLLKDELTAKNGTPEQLELIHDIEVSVNALALMVNDILDVSRIEQGRMKFEPVPNDPHTVLNDVCKGLALVAAEKKLSFILEFNASGTIMVDPARFRQIATNIIGNAIKYTEIGEVRVATHTENGLFVMRVSDTGIGITADELSQLFKKFYRTPAAADVTHTGSGLGLWITKQLVEAMDGTISVESIRGVGSHFIVTFATVHI